MNDIDETIIIKLEKSVIISLYEIEKAKNNFGICKWQRESVTF